MELFVTTNKLQYGLLEISIHLLYVLYYCSFQSILPPHASSSGAPNKRLISSLGDMVGCSMSEVSTPKIDLGPGRMYNCINL